MTNICRTLSLVTVGALTMAAAQSWAQSAASFYEQGVNAFFAGRIDQAESYLSDAIAYDSQDPRAYYFRAFTLMRQGRCAEARGDMMTGAQMEALSPRQVAIGTALERIQGPSRLMLEEIRRQARLQAGGAAAPGMSGASQNSIVRPGEEGVLRQRRVVPIDEFLRPGGPRMVEPPAQAPSEMRPAAPAATMPAEMPAADTAPAEKPEAPASNPFGDDTQPKAPAIPPQAVPTPPATPPQDTTETPPAATPPADASDNPFNG